MINHVTYQVTYSTLYTHFLNDLMESIGFWEVEPDDPHEHGYNVRWYMFSADAPMESTGTLIHFVNDAADDAEHSRLGLGHFCIAGLGEKRYDTLRDGPYCERNSGSGRAWLRVDNIRVEIRP